MSIDVAVLFDRYEWSYEQIDDEIWRTTFATDPVATEQEDEFDVYVAQSDDWIHFAISPFTPLPRSDCQAALYDALLRLNQQITGARFAVDEEGDVNLLIDLPRAGFDYPQFATALDTLVHYAQRLGRDLARVATDPSYQSPLF